MSLSAMINHTLETPNIDSILTYASKQWPNVGEEAIDELKSLKYMHKQMSIQIKRNGKTITALRGIIDGRHKKVNIKLYS